jgi:prepilin-type N-terminal cleavage/methylation domain-containing protein
MILRKIRSLLKDQAGFTLIEIIAVLAISSIIALGATMANGQLITQTVRNNAFTTANRNVLNAIQWMSRDAQMSQYVTGYYINSDNTGFPVDANLHLSWTTWDNHTCQVTYFLDNNSHLKRFYSVDDGPVQEEFIAQYILPESTNCTWQNTDNQTYQLTINIGGAVGEGDKTISVIKQETISPRPLIK